MNGFKRCCYILFAIIGIVLIGALILCWVGPWTTLFTGLIAYDWYLFGLEILVVLCLIGFAALFIRGVTAKKRKDILLFSENGDEVRITRSAIASQASYLVEQDGTCYATKVVVKARGGRSVDVKVFVEPHEPIDVAQEAKKLQKRLRSSLDTLCAGRLNRLEISFIDPRLPTGLSTEAAGVANDSEMSTTQDGTDAKDTSE